MTREELEERIYGDYYKSEEERDAFIKNYIRSYKAPEINLSQEETSKMVDNVFKKVEHDRLKRNAMRALAMDRALHTRMSI